MKGSAPKKMCSREKQDEEDIRERIFIKWEIMKIKYIL